MKYQLQKNLTWITTNNIMPGFPAPLEGRCLRWKEGSIMANKITKYKKKDGITYYKIQA